VKIHSLGLFLKKSLAKNFFSFIKIFLKKEKSPQIRALKIKFPESVVEAVFRAQFLLLGTMFYQENIFELPALLH